MYFVVCDACFGQIFVSQAYAKMVKTYQEELEKQRKKDEEERRRYREMVQRQKRMLEAAFDGNNDEILAILKEVNRVIKVICSHWIMGLYIVSLSQLLLSNIILLM